MVKSNYKSGDKKKINLDHFDQYSHNVNNNASAIQSDDISKDLSESLRPQYLEGIIGRKSEKSLIKKMIASAKTRNDSIDHILFYGPPGLGKTTFASVISREMGVNIIITNGAVIDKVGDLAAILTSLNDRDILFIDEIHRLRPVIEEVLYPAMEDRVVDVLIGKGPSAKTLRLELEKFTLIGATTQLSKISAPLRDRFGTIIRLDYYDEDDLVQILNQKAKILNTNIDRGAALTIANRARMTPRLAIRLLKIARDFASAEDSTIINENIVQDMLSVLKIYDYGLNQIDLAILKALSQHSGQKPLGLKTLAAISGEDMITIETVHEPFLIKLGYIVKTNQGRQITERGLEIAQRYS